MKRRPRPSSARHQHGAAALALAALMVVFSTTLAGSYYLGSRGTPSATGQEQTESLRWAQEAVTGFTAAHGRLPCAASEREGAENCAPGNGKGWLPVATLEQFAHPPSARGRLRIRYLVYRGTDGGADPDLALAEDVFQPGLADGSAPAAYPAVVSSVDLCGKLRAASLPSAADRWAAGDGPKGATARADRANVELPSGGGIMNVAYAVAVSPTGAPDDPSSANAGTGPAMEGPSRAVDARYRDVVRAVGFGTLFEKLSCAMTTASLDGIATAASLTADAAAMRQGTIDGSARAVRTLSFIVAGAIFEVGSSGLDLRNAIGNAAQSTTLVTANTPLLPEPPAVVAVASGTAGVATSLSTLAQAKIDLGRSIAGLLVESTNITTYRIAQKKGEDSHVWTGSTDVLKVADSLGVTP